MNTSTQWMFMSVQRIDIHSCLLKLRCVINCQTFNLSLFNYIDIFRPLYCINSLGPNSAVFESLHKEKHINSTRKKVQSVTQRKIHMKLAQFFKNSTKLSEIYRDHSVKSRHFETELNMSLEVLSLEFGIVCVCTRVWANKQKMYHKHGMSRLLRT